MMRSEPELYLETRLAQMLPGVSWVYDKRFHPTRKWRFDFADKSRRIAIEVEGGTWAGGRHTRGAGFEGDCEKYNEATRLGWKVYRFTSAMVYDDRAIEYMLRVYE